MKHLFQFTKRMAVIVFSILLVCIVSFITIVYLYSSGKIAPYLDANGNTLAGSLAEKTFLLVGGVTQGMIIKSKNINNPVLLYLHGGPAFPNYFLIEKFQPGLEDYFTVCYWEQRGGGLSYTPEVKLSSMNFNQLASDAIEVTHYLEKRFGKEKIYLMAHSGGTPIALFAIQKRPELYQAYIGMGQITNQAASEKLAYQYMLEQYSNQGNQHSMDELKKYPVLVANSSLLSYYQSGLRDQYMHELGIGTMHRMTSVFRDIFIPVWTCNAYTIQEKINIWQSKFSFLPKTNLNKELLSTDFTNTVPALDIPVYFFSGKYDYTVNFHLAKAYLGKLQASIKGFYTFRHSAHSPLYEEPALVREIIEKDILNGGTSLADKD